MNLSFISVIVVPLPKEKSCLTSKRMNIAEVKTRFFSNFSTKPHILYEGAIFLRKFNIKN